MFENPASMNLLNEQGRVLQGMFENPEFAKMAEQIGSKMLAADPNMKDMLEKMQARLCCPCTVACL